MCIRDRSGSDARTACDWTRAGAAAGVPADAEWMVEAPQMAAAAATVRLAQRRALLVWLSVPPLSIAATLAGPLTFPRPAGQCRHRPAPAWGPGCHVWRYTGGRQGLRSRTDVLARELY